MKVLNKQLHSLKSGHLFAVFEVLGKKEERLNLAEHGLMKPLLFFHEAPKTMNDCCYFAAENCIELGGAEFETKRTLYLIVDKEGG